MWFWVDARVESWRLSWVYQCMRPERVTSRWGLPAYKICITYRITWKERGSTTHTHTHSDWDNNWALHHWACALQTHAHISTHTKVRLSKGLVRRYILTILICGICYILVNKYGGSYSCSNIRHNSTLIWWWMCNACIWYEGLSKLVLIRFPQGSTNMCMAKISSLAISS